MAIFTLQTYLARQHKNEDQFTANTNMFVSQNYPFLNGFYFHIPNESSTSDKMRMKLHAMGVLPGAPDFRFETFKLGGVLMKIPGVSSPKMVDNFIPGWYLELKMPGGTLSNAQRILHGKWITAGIDVVTCYNQEQVYIELCKRYGPAKFIS